MTDDACFRTPMRPAARATVPPTPPIVISTPKLSRMLRPLTGKLAHFKRATESAPSALREMLDPFTPRRHIPTNQLGTGATQSGPEPASQRTLRSKRSLTPPELPPPMRTPESTPTFQLLSVVSGSAASTQRGCRVPADLQPTVQSVHDGYRELVTRTWRTSRTRPTSGPLALSKLAAFAAGDLFAGCNSNADGESLEDLYQELPLQYRSLILLQHGTKLCIENVHAPTALLGLMHVCAEQRCAYQFRCLFAAAVAEPAALSLDFLTSAFAFAIDLGCPLACAAKLAESFDDAAYLERVTFVQLAKHLADTHPAAALVYAGTAFARFLALMPAADCPHLHMAAFAEILVGVLTTHGQEPTACAFQVATLRQLDSSLARVLANKSANSRLLAAVYPATLVLLCLTWPDFRPHTSLSALRALRAPFPDLAPLYRASHPTAWVRVARHLQQAHGLDAHTLPIVRYLLDDAIGEDRRAGMTALALSQWLTDLEMDLVEADEAARGPRVGLKVRFESPLVVERKVEEDELVTVVPIPRRKPQPRPKTAPAAVPATPHRATPSRPVRRAREKCDLLDLDLEDELLLPAPQKRSRPSTTATPEGSRSSRKIWRVATPTTPLSSTTRKPVTPCRPPSSAVRAVAKLPVTDDADELAAF
ncbi:hypothetical protein H9P43_004821 [Blastocladiella emersonii ATCC 22665]|nr:hypothetical protein H9P43_004821 [Blastocladiella emersonii ATCC 22665]